MNRTLALFLGVALLLVCSACKGGQSGKDKERRPEVEDVRLWRSRL